MMRTFFAPKTVLPPTPPLPTPPPPTRTDSTAALSQISIQESLENLNNSLAESFAEQVMFWSDMSSDSSELEDENEISDEELESRGHPDPVVEAKRLPQAPPCKRRKLDVPYRTQRQLQHERNINDQKKAHVDIEKLLASRKTKFVAGENGLQMRRARAIECYFRLKIKNGRSTEEAGERAAESQGFAPRWGGRQVRSWAKVWMKERELPQSARGSHAKVSSLLDDPKIAAELRTYLRSNKWAMNPGKLADFSKNKLIPSIADQYLRKIIRDEMPQGLKRYMEYELFPRIHLKVGRGVSLSTARRWMHKEGFRYISYAKGLYYDGHDRPDVVEYRQKHFLPMMKKHEERLVKYVIGDVDKEVVMKPTNYVERRLVLAPHDETTTQANDGHGKGWVLDNQFPLRKKGQGRGLHESGAICGTVGYLKEGRQTLEYGKNYDGYWTGELFIKQVCTPGLCCYIYQR